MSLDPDQIEIATGEVTDANDGPESPAATATSTHPEEDEDEEAGDAKLEQTEDNPQVKVPLLSTERKLRVIHPKTESHETPHHDEDIEAAGEDQASAQHDSSIDSLDLDLQSPEELHALYEGYQARFKSSITQSQRLFESLRNQNFTLAYYHRRNQSLLTVLDELEDKKKELGDGTCEDLLDRMQRVVEKMPRCKDALIPFIELFENGKVAKNELVNLYMLEKVPDLVNDDLVKLQTNPQSIENWCIRNNPNLINLNYKPITIDNLQDYNGGTEYLLNLNDDFLTSQSSGNRKKRKLEKK
ncbi:hypothetical protein Cantr_10122 [Candida viswanathii]|uniref:Uncharacterized protein n=1 Tax=Candida viswanathii TaxID=5486 RepID=A0A367YEJ4_9ASCO|nr:hypothetical protein Cantr_10122 [Candida viswanathii]